MSRLSRTFFLSLTTAAALAAISLAPSLAQAQQPPPPAQPFPFPIPGGLPQIPGLPALPGQQPPPGAPAPGGYQQPGYGQPQQPGGQYPQQPPAKDPDSTTLEVGYLVGTAAVWGVGSGILFDVALKIEGGLAIVPPLVLGVAAPIGVVVADRIYDPMPRGLPSAVATGMWVFGGLGLGITSTIALNSSGEGAVSFTGVAAGTFVGSLVGAGAGAAGWWFLDLEPETNLFVFSGTTQGTLLGMQFGGGAMANSRWRVLNDGLSAGGLAGLGVGLVASSAVSWFYKPSWDQVGWMWGGFAIGQAVGLVGYPIMLATDDPWNRGMIIQGAAGAIGLGVGLLLADDEGDEWYAENRPTDPTEVRVMGGGFRPLSSPFAPSLLGPTTPLALSGSSNAPPILASNVLDQANVSTQGIEAYVTGVW